MQIETKLLKPKPQKYEQFVAKLKLAQPISLTPPSNFFFRVGGELTTPLVPNFFPRFQGSQAKEPASQLDW